MAAVEDLLDIMRKQGSIDNPSGLELAEMTGPASAAIGDLTLDPEDLYIPDRLTKKMAVEVKGITTEGTNDITDKSEYSDPLKAGDLVVVYQLSDSKYVILDRVVSGDEV